MDSDKNHVIFFSVDAEKIFGKIQYLLVIKAQRGLGIEGTYLNMKKTMNGKPGARVRLNGEQFKSGRRQMYLLALLLSSASSLRELNKTETNRKRSQRIIICR